MSMIPKEIDSNFGQEGQRPNDCDDAQGSFFIDCIFLVADELKTDINIDHINNLGWTALLEAIILGDGGPRHTEVVWLLVEAGADVNLADSNGITPLSHASQRGYQQIIEILVGLALDNRAVISALSQR